jgi:uncharacterized SAM-binding protein YcdF (DUF218 family)
VFKNRVALIYVALGFIGILDTIIVLRLNGGRNLGTLLPGVLGIFMVLWGITRIYIKEHFLRNHFPRFCRLIRLGFIVLLSSFLIIEGTIFWNTKDEIPDRVDYLVILGAGLNGDQLSWTLWERVNKGLKVLEENPEMKVVVSGGQGPGETISEAEAMARYLVGRGISKERILKEERSTSTMENFRYTQEMLAQEPGYNPSETVLVITNDFHMFRAKILARRNGLNPVGVPSPTPWYLRPNAYLREYFAVVKSLVFDR